jgi:hypothetical protein
MSQILEIESRRASGMLLLLPKSKKGSGAGGAG